MEQCLLKSNLPSLAFLPVPDPPSDLPHEHWRETTRCTRLFGRSTTAREIWLQQPNLLKILNHFLRTEFIPYNDSGNTKVVTDAILSAAATLDIGSGVKAQDLHQDDFVWQYTQRNERIRVSMR